ncbi:hypothetical protein JCM10213v2_001779 [Rhodosporidiobolus nylandii]
MDRPSLSTTPTTPFPSNSAAPPDRSTQTSSPALASSAAPSSTSPSSPAPEGGARALSNGNAAASTPRLPGKDDEDSGPPSAVEGAEGTQAASFKSPLVAVGLSSLERLYEALPDSSSSPLPAGEGNAFPQNGAAEHDAGQTEYYGSPDDDGGWEPQAAGLNVGGPFFAGGAGPRRTGHCKFFNAQKGFGFILDDRADELGGDEVFVHYSSVAIVQSGPTGFRSLLEGEAVEYDIAQGAKGWQAQNVTGPNASIPSPTTHPVPYPPQPTFAPPFPGSPHGQPLLLYPFGSPPAHPPMGLMYPYPAPGNGVASGNREGEKLRPSQLPAPAPPPGYSIPPPPPPPGAIPINGVSPPFMQAETQGFPIQGAGGETSLYSPLNGNGYPISSSASSTSNFGPYPISSSQTSPAGQFLYPYPPPPPQGALYTPYPPAPFPQQLPSAYPISSVGPYPDLPYGYAPYDGAPQLDADAGTAASAGLAEEPYANVDNDAGVDRRRTPA